MVYNSLTEIPRNVKECFDWLIAVKGSSRFNTQALGFALHNFLVDMPVGLTRVPSLEMVKRFAKGFLEQKELKQEPHVTCLLAKYRSPMNKTDGMDMKRLFCYNESDYDNVVKSKNISRDEMASIVARVAGNCERFLKRIKTPAQYESAYSSEATWEASCALKPTECAAILVGIAPMLYAGLISLWISSNPELFGEEKSVKEKRLGRVMKILGFEEPGCREDLTRISVRQALVDMDKEIIERIYEIAGFWAFY
ncbi:hypothetical protein BBBOND_0107910 [Babesia bigemina]|uniref:Uncharacterized protein n=1 Tax=Babesia bigemina TaxID=5866 RepID=A0A061D1H5_BABBI|nr:hypothetical protein BBBOND_0107910 [Babesia bigemina]CDR94493.1 hypothetical protein BBBOND_0107910 [Babesia bigemina]|eukprot:XP_012766679.1 hypothetical protein BBBOND_0107910 [Babesia bigemina]